MMTFNTIGFFGQKVQNVVTPNATNEKQSEKFLGYCDGSLKHFRKKRAYLKGFQGNFS